jgi:hypothetical protein
VGRYLTIFTDYTGLALQNAQSNTFIAQLPNNASAKMGLLHASYGKSRKYDIHSDSRKNFQEWAHSLPL